MPSDYAFLEVPEVDIIGGYDSATNIMGQYNSQQTNLALGGLSIRNVYQPLTALQGLGVHIDMNSKLMRALRTVIITNYSIFMLQGAYRAIVKAREAREVALSISETAAMAVAQQWANIAIAAGAALLVGGSLAVGYVVGEHLGSGDWNLPSLNLSNPQDRRTMEHSLPQEVKRRG